MRHRIHWSRFWTETGRAHHPHLLTDDRPNNRTSGVLATSERASERPGSTPSLLARYVALLLAALVPALIMRSHAVARYGASGDDLPSFALAVARGVGSDGLVAAAFGLLALAPARWRTWELVAAILFWSLLAAGNHEHVAYNASNIDVAFARYGATKTFVLGSVLVPSIWLKAGICAAVTYGVCRIFLTLSPDCQRRFVRRAAPATIAVALALTPASLSHPRWVQGNVVWHNASRLASQLLLGSDAAPRRTLPSELRAAYFARDLGGTPRVPYPSSRPNVLILVIEGMGIGHVTKRVAPTLERLAEEHLTFRRFVTCQRQTNRGLYALLCADYPNLRSKESKADFVDRMDAPERFLPAILRRAGYRTVFIQSAELGFMRKDLFGAAIGFERVLGGKEIATAYSRSGWGVDDRALLERSADEILALSEEAEPWFMTILTSGSHPPYNVPASFLASGRDPSLRDAFRYMDRALAVFIDRLRGAGVLEETLILITSDEVAGATPRGENIYLYPHVAFLVAMTPDSARGSSYDLFMQPDLCISVADYLGLAEGVPLGRSFFREYEEPRTVLFGNTYGDFVGALAEDGNLLICDREFEECTSYRTSRAPGSFTETPPPAHARVRLRRAVAFSDRRWEDYGSDLLFEETDHEYDGEGRVVGDHKVAVAPGEALVWTLRARSLGAHDTTLVLAALREKLVDGRPSFLFEHEIRIEPGQTVELRRTFRAAEDEPCVRTDVAYDCGAGGFLLEQLTIRKHAAGSKPTEGDYTRTRPTE